MPPTPVKNLPSDQSDIEIAPELQAFRAVLAAIRARLLGGMLLLLPIAITGYVIFWVMSLFHKLLVQPVAWFLASNLLSDEFKNEVPWWYGSFAAPVLAVTLLLIVLYTAGLFVRSRLRRIIDWAFTRVPLFDSVYKATSSVVQTFEKQQNSKSQFKRVVLISFPHPGCKVPAFVTSSCVEKNSGKTLLCVYVPTTPVPTSGYMLMIPEEDVIEIDWDLQATLQAIVSGGMSVPETITYLPQDVIPST